MTHEDFRKHRFGWDWAIAHKMLVERVRSQDAALGRIRRGAEYLEPIHLDPADYWVWVARRPEAIMKLMQAATIQITSDLPAVVGRVVGEEDLEDVKVAVDALAELYTRSVQFERDCHAVVPPDVFAELHKSTHGWTDPIRDAVKELVEFTRVLGSRGIEEALDGQVEPPSLNIVVKSSPKVDEFLNKVDDIDPGTLDFQ